MYDVCTFDVEISVFLMETKSFKTLRSVANYDFELIGQHKTVFYKPSIFEVLRPSEAL